MTCSLYFHVICPKGIFISLLSPLPTYRLGEQTLLYTHSLLHHPSLHHIIIVTILHLLKVSPILIIISISNNQHRHLLRGNAKRDRTKIDFLVSLNARQDKEYTCNEILRYEIYLFFCLQCFGLSFAFEFVIWVLIKNMNEHDCYCSATLIITALLMVVGSCFVDSSKASQLEVNLQIEAKQFQYFHIYAKRSTSQTRPLSTSLLRLLHHLAPLHLLTEVVQVERSPPSRILVQPSTKAVAMWLFEVFIVLWSAYWA